MPALQGCLDRTGGEGRGPRRPDSPPPLWLVWMPEQPCLGPSNKSEALGRRPGEAGHVPPPPPHGLGSLAASSVFPRGETWFSPGSAGAAGKGSQSLPAPWWSWRPGHRCSCPLGVWGPLPPPTRTGVSQEGESCQVTCRGQHEPEAPASHLTQEEAGRALSGRQWTGGSHLMAWARVCASCCRQLAEAVLPTPTGVGAEERTPLLGPTPATQSPGPLIRRVPGSPDAGFSCPTNCFTSSDPLWGGSGEAGLSPGGSCTRGPGATRASWPTAVLADLEQDARQGECALPRAAPAGLVPLKPEANQSSSPGPTSCMGARVEAQPGTRDTGSAGPEPQSGGPRCYRGPVSPEPRKGQRPTTPGGLWGQ